MSTDSPLKVAYLFGAGATQGCVTRANSQRGVLMKDIREKLNEKLGEIVENEFAGNDTLTDLVNGVFYGDADFEQVISFLDDAPSKVHRDLADRMKEIFQEVLQELLGDIRTELGNDPVELYAALLDMYNVSGFPEVLQGIMTLNYDHYIEKAAELVGNKPIDFGFQVGEKSQAPKCFKLLKLHGSFDWGDTWPTSIGNGKNPLWIPPGIQKEKQAYPFNVLWGLAREMLDCDVLRIVGCRLGANDWDLISLLFTTRHVGSDYQPYRIEVIDWPSNAVRLQREYSYLEAQSILELEGFGHQIIGELGDGEPRYYDDMSEEAQRTLIDSMDPGDHNWFEMWLRLKAEYHNEHLDSLDTDKGLLSKFLERQPL